MTHVVMGDRTRELQIIANRINIASGADQHRVKRVSNKIMT